MSLGVPDVVVVLQQTKGFSAWCLNSSWALLKGRTRQDMPYGGLLSEKNRKNPSMDWIAEISTGVSQQETWKQAKSAEVVACVVISTSEVIGAGSA